VAISYSLRFGSIQQDQFDLSYLDLQPPLEPGVREASGRFMIDMLQGFGGITGPAICPKDFGGQRLHTRSRSAPTARHHGEAFGRRAELRGYSRQNIEAVGRIEFARWNGDPSGPMRRLDACVKQLGADR